MKIESALKCSGTMVCTGLLLCGGAFFASSNLAQEPPSQRLAHLESILKSLNKLPPQNRARLSAGIQTFIQMATDEVAAANSASSQIQGKSLHASRHRFSPKSETESSTPPEGTVFVSNPRLDFVNSASTGFSQFQSSTAWCGENLVVAYTDTGAALRASGNSTLDGVSFSNDNGRTFTDVGVINTNPLSMNNDQELTGTSVAACSGDQFYYASTGFNDVEDNGGSAILFSRASATDLSQWSPPAPVIARFADEFVIDMPWLAVDPSNAQQLYLTYTSFDNGFTGGPPFCEFAQTLELIASSDGGFTWGMPVVLDTECEGGEFGVSSGFTISGSNVAVSPTGKVYVDYLAFGASSSSQVRFVASHDHGQTFGATQTVATFTNPGAGQEISLSPGLQANIRPDTLPSLTVDRSAGASRETIYLAWVQGDRTVTQGITTYAYGDIVVAKSMDQGHSFAFLGPVSPQPKHFIGRGRDQFTPGIAVDKTGTILVCYYDRRNDPNNISIDRFCSTSRDRGRTWDDERASAPNWLPYYGDLLRSNLGVYDTVTSDFSQKSVGFMASFEFVNFGNPEIVGRRSF
jgi:hypothetical protein